MTFVIICCMQLSREIVFGPTAQFIRYDEIDELSTPWDAYIVGWGALTVSEFTIDFSASATRDS